MNDMFRFAIQPWKIEGPPSRLARPLRIRGEMAPGNSFDFILRSASIRQLDIRKQGSSRPTLVAEAMGERPGEPELKACFGFVADLAYVKEWELLEKLPAHLCLDGPEIILQPPNRKADLKVAEKLRDVFSSLSLPDVHPTVSASIAKNCSVAIIDMANTTAANPLAGIVGSGVLLDDIGTVATNRHVIEAAIDENHAVQPGRLKVLFWIQGETGIRGLLVDAPSCVAVAEVTDRPGDVGDLAFLDTGLLGLPGAPLYSSPFALAVGARVVTAGYPAGPAWFVEENDIRQPAPFVHQGAVSVLRRRPFLSQYTEMEQIVCDLPVIGGSSGSPVFLTDRAELIGIVSHSLNTLSEVQEVKSEQERQLYARMSGPASLLVPVNFICHALREVDTHKWREAPRRHIDSIK